MRNGDIRLRYIEKADIDDYIRWTTTETEWGDWDAPWEPWEKEDYDSFVRRQTANLGKTPGFFSKLEIEAKGRHIGWVSSYFMDDYREKTAIGIDIPEVRDRSRGYGEKALALFMAYLFERETELFTQTWSGNAAMIRLAEKTGFSEVGRKKNFREVRGGLYDALTFRISREDFFRKHQALRRKVNFMYQKRIAAVHDISCFGKCSLTVALPIISAVGIEVSVLPTAVLSTHTGGFSGYTYRDLTEDIMPIIDHWQTLDLKFDAVYTGFLGSYEQLDIVSGIFDIYREQGSFIAVDPVMGDNGSLYGIFPQDFPMGMKKLCEKADIIMPNITEALLLLSEPYREGPYSKEFIEDMLRRLADFGPDQVVVTGVYFDEFQLGAASFNKRTGEIKYAMREKIEGSYHGTGDVFASSLVGALRSGVSLPKSVEIAADFTVESIRRTKEAGTDIRFGVNFEEGLADLIRAVDSAAGSDGQRSV